MTSINQQCLSKSPKTCHDVLHCENKHQLLFRKNGYNLLACPQCELGYVNVPDFEDEVKAVFDDDYFFGGKDGYPDYLREKKLIIESGKQYGRILSKFTKPGKILDVGAAAGFILNGILETGWEGMGIEPNDTMASYARKTMGMDVRVETLESFKTDEKFDAISIIQVIGCIPDLDPSICKVNQFLKSGGYVIVESWVRNSIAAKMF